MSVLTAFKCCLHECQIYTHILCNISNIFFEWIYRYSWNYLSTVTIHHLIFTYIYKHDAVFSLNCYHLKTITLYLYILENCEYRLCHIKIEENIFNRKISFALLKLVCWYHWLNLWLEIAISSKRLRCFNGNVWGMLQLRYCTTQICRQFPIAACTNLAPNIHSLKPDLSLTDQSVEQSNIL